jgi:hypothetical protein
MGNERALRWKFAIVANERGVEVVEADRREGKRKSEGFRGFKALGSVSRDL